MNRSFLIAGLTAGAALLIGPGTALASDVVGSTPALHVQSNTVVTHDLSVKVVSGNNAVPNHSGPHAAYIVDDGSEDMTQQANPACEIVNPTDGDGGQDAVCALDDTAAVTSVELDGGGLADKLTIDPSVPLGAVLIGYPGNDKLTGGVHDDTLYGDENNDTLDGGGGSDYLSGGNGRDTVTYASRTAPVTADIEPTTQGGGPYDDGGAADLSGVKRDAIASDIENLTGGSAADKLTGDRLANKLLGGGGRDVLKGLGGKDKAKGGGGKDRLLGGGANDVLIGGGGNDTINGGKGRDRLLGKGGKDTLKAKDGKRDKKINCGSGSADKATVDRTKDPAARGCETVIKR